MKRQPEPEELMDDPAQARAYAEADFSEPNTLFLTLFAQAAGGEFAGRALDLGCGPGDIPLAFARRYPDAEIEVLDGASAMLAIAREKLSAEPALAPRVRLRQTQLPCAELPPQHYDAVLSNSLLHHMGDPTDLWRTVRQCARPGAYVLVMDLARPPSLGAVERLVEAHARDAPGLLRRDFRNSLRAAYTPEEVTEQLRTTGLDCLEVTMVSDRHLAAQGILA